MNEPVLAALPALCLYSRLTPVCGVRAGCMGLKLLCTITVLVSASADGVMRRVYGALLVAISSSQVCNWRAM